MRSQGSKLFSVLSKVAHILPWMDRTARPSRPRPARRSRPLVLEALEDRCVPAAISWTGLGDGMTWEDVNNWSLIRLPNPADAATIGNAGGSIAMNANESVGSLSFTSAATSLVGAGKLTVGNFTFAAASITTTADIVVTGTFTWNRGAIGGGGNLTLGTTTTLAAGLGTLTITNRQVTNTGIVSWVSGNILLSGGTTITNAAGATFDAQDDFSLTADPNGARTETFNNQGTFKKSRAGAGSTATVIDCNFNNDNNSGVGGPATVRCDGWVLQFRGNGTHTGSFTALDPAQIQFLRGTQTLQNGTQFLGSGPIVVRAAAVFSIPNGSVVSNLGNLQLSGGGTFSGSGIIPGSGKLVNLNSFQWAGGIVSNLRLTNAANGQMQLTGPIKVLDSSILENRGSIVWDSGPINMNTTNSGCAIWNYGTFDAQANATIRDGSQPALGVFARIFNGRPPGETTGGGIFKNSNAANVPTINPKFINSTGGVLDKSEGDINVTNYDGQGGTVLP